MVSEAQKTSGYILPDPITGYDLICVKMKIPDVGEYRQAFYSQIFYLARFWAWEKSGVSGDTRASQAGKYWQELIEQHYQIGECDLYLLRQNPDEPCQLQQSTNGGDSWSLAFDYSLCMTTDPATKYLLKIQVGIQSGDWQADYDAGEDEIGAVFPDVVYDDSPADFDRNTALCYALHGYVIGICEASAQTIEANEAILDNVAYALGLAAAATGLWAGFGLTFWIPLGLALGALGAEIASEVLGNDADDYRNEVAQEEVICYMYNRLKNDTVEAGDFADALTGESFTGDAEKIADAVAVTLNNIDAYLAFMNIVSEGFTLAQNSLIENTCFDCCSDLFFSFDDASTATAVLATGSVAGSTIWQPHSWSVGTGAWRAGSHEFVIGSALSRYGFIQVAVDPDCEYNGFSVEVKTTLVSGPNESNVSVRLYDTNIIPRLADNHFIEAFNTPPQPEYQTLSNTFATRTFPAGYIVIGFGTGGDKDAWVIRIKNFNLVT